MNDRENGISKKDPSGLIKVKLSKVQFPEYCPVCMDEAEDLVAIMVFETTVDHWSERRGLASGWAKQRDHADIALSHTKGGSIFWVPACLSHGSDTITTPRKQVVSIIGFMFLFYPLLYFILGLLAAIEYSRPVLDSLIPVTILLCAMVFDIMYGFYPRSLEKSIQFLDINYSKDEAVIYLKNDRYRELFLRTNEMTAESLRGESTKTEGQ
ncbi:MAG: hypothetical protein ACFFED_16915 [Candidatus Thorarchaeota archaeon]